MPIQSPPTIDPIAARRWQLLPCSASPWLHEEVARRMQERLDWITVQPQNWTHWEPLRGGLQAHALLADRYAKAPSVVVESDTAKAAQADRILAPPWWQGVFKRRASTRVNAPEPAMTQMLWANMGLHMSAEPQALIGRWFDALAVHGFLMFSCLGPDTLLELRAVYRALGWPEPSHAFTDMHDWGDMLMEAGFGEPVMDMERITLTFETPQRLLEELRGLGRNLHPQRMAGLRGRKWRDRLHDALAQAPLQITFEVIYGHAFKPAPRLDVRAETVLSVDQMRQALRQNRKNPAKS